MEVKLMTLENKVTITQEGKKVIIECLSNGHPLDEVVTMLFKGLIKSGMTKAD